MTKIRSESILYMLNSGAWNRQTAEEWQDDLDKEDTVNALGDVLLEPWARPIFDWLDRQRSPQ